MRARGWRPSYPIGSLEIGAGHAAHHRVSLGYRRAGARRPRRAQRQRGGDQRHHVRSADARQQRRQADRRPAPVAPERRARDRRLGARGARTSPMRRSRARRCSAGRRARRSTRSASTRSTRAITGWCAASHLEPVAGADAVATLDATSAFVEGRYKISPGLFVAGRIDRLGFSELALVSRSPYRGTRRSRASRRAPATTFAAICSQKRAYQHNWRDGGIVTQPRAVRGAAAFLAVA